MPNDRFLEQFLYTARNSPVFDDVVTAENCYYYLSLLESFYELEQSMSPELFKRYIVAAERRYLEFMTKVDNWYEGSEALPLDIAYAWHAHLLSPFRYCEDHNLAAETYSSLKLPFMKHFPLKQMHFQRVKKSQGGEIGPVQHPLRFPIYPYVLDTDELQHTKFDAKARYHLDVSAIHGSTMTVERFIHKEFGLYIKCASCDEELFLQSWEEYEQFRTDPNVSIRCPSLLCKNPDNTVNSISVKLLLEALPHNVKGTRFTNCGRFIKEPEKNQRQYIQAHFNRVIKAQKTTLHSIKDVCNLLSENISELGTFGEPPADQKHARRSYAREFIDIIRSSYEGNPTNLSLDLVQAMHRQREFIRTMITKITPKWVNPMELEIPNAIRDYHDFLLLNKGQQDRAIVPTWSVDMVWHVHMLHCNQYTRMGYRELDRILNHDDVISHLELNQHLTATAAAWHKAFPSLVGLNIFSLTMQGIHSWNPSLMQNAHVYNGLQKTMINYHTRRRLENSGITFTSPQDLSYHGIDYKGTMYCESQTSREPSKKKYSTDAYQEIFKGIEYTGYGYIGSSVRIDEVWSPSDIKKRIGATLHPPVHNRFVREWTSRRVGRIMPGAKITPLTRERAKKFSVSRKGALFGVDGRFQWWVPRYGLYGLMRRKYSKKLGEWGWTTDGFDWYSESECNFVPELSGEFFGATFRESQQPSNNPTTDTTTGSSTFCSSGNYDFGSYDNGGISYSGGSSGGDSGGGGASGGGDSSGW
ncbi:hypothetical protein BJV82DRAFT_618215 [Fennellomyces sp. T-0311]|nr:hypothetical protein BJV82DRAFT_618215 [Fennellomyces sp. T-0311]